MLVSRSIRDLGKTFTRIQLIDPKSNQSLQPLRAGSLRSLLLQVQGSRDFHCQHKHIYQALLSRRPLPVSPSPDFSKSTLPSTTLRRRFVTAMAVADRSILPDTYVLSSIASDVVLRESASKLSTTTSSSSTLSLAVLLASKGL